MSSFVRVLPLMFHSLIAVPANFVHYVFTAPITKERLAALGVYARPSCKVGL
jgi:hypothetical protein